MLFRSPPTRGWENAGSVIQTSPNKQNLPPVIVSVSVGDRSGRTLTGQTLEAFYTSVKHYPLLAFGLNCSLGAAEMTTLLEEVNKWCECAVSCYPNAGLPNEMGGYDQTPEQMGEAVKVMAGKGLVNILGGCCGTSPAHIKAIAQAVKGLPSRPSSRNSGLFLEMCQEKEGSSKNYAVFVDKPQNKTLKVSGLEAVEVDVKKNNFTNVDRKSTRLNSSHAT